MIWSHITNLSVEKLAIGELDSEVQITATPAELNLMDLSAVGALRKVAKIAITAPEDGTEQSTGFTLPDKCVVHAVYLDVTTAEATGTTKTITVGTDSTDSGDADGFLAGVSVAATGLVKGTLASAGQTLGALLVADEDGAGALVPEADISSGGKEVTFTAASADFAELVANIFIEYTEIA